MNAKRKLKALYEEFGSRLVVVIDKEEFPISQLIASFDRSAMEQLYRIRIVPSVLGGMTAIRLSDQREALVKSVDISSKTMDIYINGLGPELKLPYKATYFISG